MISLQRILFLVNPLAGARCAPRLSDQMSAELRSQGFVTTIVDSVSARDLHGALLRAYRDQLQAHDAVVFASGDGTISTFLPLLAETQKPIYLLPMGNESLFARLHCMDRSAAKLAAALRAGESIEQYYAVVAGQPFHSMLELDAVAAPTADRFARWRWGGSHHLFYVFFGIPSVAGMAFRSLVGRQVNPRFSVAVDGLPFLSDVTGSLLIAKTAEYAGNIRLAPHADGRSPLLTVGFHPNTTVFDQLYRVWCIKCRTSAVRWSDAMRIRQGQEVVITVHGLPFPYQVDGERVPSEITPPGNPITVAVHPVPIRVLQSTG